MQLKDIIIIKNYYKKNKHSNNIECFLYNRNFIVKNNKEV